MNVLIIGGGLLGRETAQQLDSQGHGVVVVDESPERLGLLDPGFGGVTQVGFPMDLNVLRRAGIESCDAVAVTTGDDNLNIAVGQIAKKYFKVERVAARISDPAREDIFERVGLLTVCPTNMAGEKLVTELVSPWQSRQVTFGAATVALEVQPVERRWFGRTTGDVDLPEGGVFGVVKEDGRFILKEAIGNIPLSEGDSLVVARKID
jgi:trk system potassium uptake protein TrkA